MNNFPQLWNTFSTLVDTDITFDEALSLLPTIIHLNANRVESHFIGLDEVNLWQTPTGAEVLVVDPVPFQETLTQFLSPPTENRLTIEQARVHVLNGTLIPGIDQLAATHLQWHGIAAHSLGSAGTQVDQSVIYDHTGNVKGSSLHTIQQTLEIDESAVFITLDPSNEADFTIVIGNDYNTCSTSPWRSFPQPD